MKDATEFERMADAMLYQPLPRLRHDDLSDALPAFPLDQESASEGAISVRMPRMYVAPVAPLHVVSDEEPPAPPAREGPQFPSEAPPPPSWHHALDAEVSGPVMLPAFMILRGGAKAPRGVGSSLLFLGLIALAVVMMVLVALAVVAPNADWALIQG